ncbi:MAG: pyridoxal-phosphate dependent enzyme, partial [Candidatus Hermodarchaeota archaeon]|nr:pyridoxal-phosphate dependent enzyme [Candidatus Hermodarchaeota archaeon]
KKRGVITHSSGNHAQAVALAAKMLEIPATIVMPKDSAKVKITATQGYGAEVVFCEPTLASREEVTSKLIKKHNYVLIHAYDNPHVIAGAGTAALELIQEVGALDYVFVPVGGGGLISGTAIASKGLNPKGKVIGVEPENANDAYRSVKAKKLLPSENPNTIADGLRTGLSKLTFSIIQQYVDDIILVSEEEILEAMRFIFERMKLVVEPSGATSLAGVFHLEKELDDLRIGVILSGGNVDLAPLFNHLKT